MLGRGILLFLLAPYALWLIFAYEYHFIDGVNLLFHEAGHVFFGFLGRTLGVLGGTLGQLVFPIAAGVHFLQRGRLFDACVCTFWLGESLMYAAEYMADARRMVLPLVGGHIHDWNWLFSRWGVLGHAETLGGLTHVLGSLVVIASFGAALALLLRERGEEENA